MNSPIARIKRIRKVNDAAASCGKLFIFISYSSQSLNLLGNREKTPS